MAVAHKTTIAFSLVSIPISLYTATQDNDIHFNQLCKDDNSRVRYAPFSNTPKGNEQAVWLEPHLVGTVKYMEKTTSGSLRQPVFKGLRDDKAPEDCVM